MKIAVIGTGISGLSVAQMLKNHNVVVLFEKQPAIGGLIKCDRVNDCLFHKVGGHVFNSRNPTVLNWFWNFFDRENEFIKAERNAKVFFNNEVVGYPIENYLYRFNKHLIKQIFAELLLLREQPQKTPFEYLNFEAFLRGNFGNTLFDVYFKPYNQKIWNTNLSEVAMEWLEGKLPMPNLDDIIMSNILREEETSMVHSTFYYPKINGSQFIVDRLSVGLDIQLGQPVMETLRLNDTYHINEMEGFNTIIYCGDIRKIPQMWKNHLHANAVDVPYLENLRSNGTSNLFCETDDTDISWLYIPENFTKAHRIIYTGNFSSDNNRGSERKTCVVEFSGKVEYDTMVAEIQKLPGNLTPLAHNYEPNSYVVQDKRTRIEIAKAKAVLEKQNIYLLGRFAEWEYYNMDKAIEAAFALRDKLNIVTT